jgi:hypothetical protein
MRYKLNHKIFSISSDGFESLALEVFMFQYEHNEIYRRFVDALLVDVTSVNSLLKIPFIPISFFKSHKVETTSFQPETIFESSGSTQMIPSRHFVKELSLYRESFSKAFELFYGGIADYCIIGLLPSYLEREHSSLTLMVDELITASCHQQSGFYLDEHDKLYSVLQDLENSKQKTILIGVSFGLLDFAERYSLSLKHTIVMETGGMKGRREELTRQQVHKFLQQRLGVTAIHAEYGMTELLSQSYSKGNGIFYCPPWMKVLLREEDDPLTVKDGSFNTGISGVINVVDLANLYSCSFIATDDVGKIYADGGFEVLGRMDNSDIRGCSLMVV